MQPATQSPPSIGQGRYVLSSVLGEGGMALVCMAYDRRLRVHRAVKVLLPHFAMRANLRERFEAEAQTMAQLEHPHIVRVYDVVTDGEVPFLVMELVTGGSLMQWLETHGAMPPRMATKACIELCRGAEAAHRRGVIHRDIKPHNVLIADDGTCKLTDFGIAQVQLGSTRTGVAMGTLGYMAPEQQANAKGVDARADVFSIGATLWKLITDGPAHHILLAIAERGVSDVPEPLQPILASCLRMDKNERPQSVTQLREHLEQALEALPKAPRSTPPLPLPPQRYEPGADGEQFGMITLALDSSAPGADSPPTWSAPTPAPAPSHTSAPVSSETPGVLPYQMPRTLTPAEVRGASGLPSYIDPDDLTSDEGGFDVTLSEKDKVASKHARQIRRAVELARSKEAPARDVLLSEAGSLPQETEGWVPWLTQRLIVAPTRVLVVPIVVASVMALVILAALQFSVAGQLKELRVVRQTANTQFEAQGPTAIDMVSALGGDRAPLDELYLQADATQGVDERIARTELLIRAMENELAAQLPDDPSLATPDQEDAIRRVRELRASLDTYKRVAGDSASWAVKLARTLGFDP